MCRGARGLKEDKTTNLLTPWSSVFQFHKLFVVLGKHSNLCPPNTWNKTSTHSNLCPPNTWNNSFQPMPTHHITSFQPMPTQDITPSFHSPSLPARWLDSAPCLAWHDAIQWSEWAHPERPGDKRAGDGIIDTGCGLTSSSSLMIILLTILSTDLRGSSNMSERLCKLKEHNHITTTPQQHSSNISDTT